MNNHDRLQELSKDLLKNDRSICTYNAAIGAYYSPAEKIVMGNLLHDQTKIITEMCLIIGTKESAPYPQNGDYRTFANGVAKNGAQA